MRIHTDTLTASNVQTAATTARVTLDRFTEHKSKSRDHAFDITLQGESKRHQNGGTGKAATWDQWGVFLAVLFDMDDSLSIPRAYAHDSDFHYKTANRFAAIGHFPHDAHGDHKFEYVGTPYSQTCKKCTATVRWQ